MPLGGMGSIQNDAYTLMNWKGNPQQGLYHNVVKVSCRTCHIAFDGNDDASGLDWNRYDQFKLNRDSIASIAVGAHLSTSGRSMPHSLVTYRNFWLDQNPAHRPKSCGSIPTCPIGLRSALRFLECTMPVRRQPSVLARASTFS